MSFYKTMERMIEASITPLAAKLGQQKYVTSIRDGFIAVRTSTCNTRSVYMWSTNIGQ